MNWVLSLIGNPAGAPVLEPALARLQALLGQDAASRTQPYRILAEGYAAEIPLAAPRKDLLGLARATLADVAVDVNLLPAQGRRKKLLVADMDSTIITCECLDEIADFIGLKPQVAAITERAMRGELAFEPALRERVALLKGLPEATLTRVYEERVRLMPGARRLVQTMRAHGAYAVLVSGGFTFFTERVAKAAGFEAHRANRLVIRAGALDGTVVEPILGREAKLAALTETAEERGLPLAATLAVGDGANDLAMIGAAGLGVAFHAKPLVAEAAMARIDHGDLTALLYLQGYAQNEFKA